MTDSPDPGTGVGDGIVRAAWWGTAAFGLTAVAAAAYAEPAAEVPTFVMAIGLFVAGCIVFVIAFLRAVSRSRTELISVADVFFLTGDTAPPQVRRQLMGALAAQVVLALATAIARPYSSLAAGTLVPVYGIGLCGLWAARYGTFARR